MLAKLAVEEAKPAGIRWIRPEEVPGVLEKTPLRGGVRDRAADRSALSHLGVLKLADLGRFPEAILRREFGVYGTTLALWGRGLDPTPLRPLLAGGGSEERRAFPRDPEGPAWTGRGEGRPSLPVRRGGAAPSREGPAARVVHFCPARCRHAVPRRTARVGNPDGRRGDDLSRRPRPVRSLAEDSPGETTLVAVRATGVIPKEETVRPLFFGERRRECLERAVDRIRDRYGDRAIWRGSVFASCRHLTQATGGLGQEKQIVLAEKACERAILSSRERGRRPSGPRCSSTR